MSFISLPKSARIGQTHDVEIGGQPKRLTWRDAETVVIDQQGAAPDTRRVIMTSDAAGPDGEELIQFLRTDQDVSW